MGIAAIGSNLFVLRSIVRVIEYEDVVRGSLIFFPYIAFYPLRLAH